MHYRIFPVDYLCINHFTSIMFWIIFALSQGTAECQQTAIIILHDEFRVAG
jgi:hypothetical protein